MIQILVCLLCFPFYNTCFASFFNEKNTPYFIEGTINHTDQKVVYLYKYEFDPEHVSKSIIDSTILDEKGHFIMTGHNIPIDKPFPQKQICRLALGDTIWVDLVIKSYDSIRFQSDYIHFVDSMHILASDENKKFFEYIHLRNNYLSDIKKLQQENISLTDSSQKQLVVIYHNTFKTYMKQLVSIQGYNKNYYASVIASVDIMPDYPDSSNYNPDKERNYMMEHFFDAIDFSNEDLILYPPLIENKYMTYLQDFIPKSNEGLKQAVDLIITKANANNKVREMTVNYLLDVFENKGPEETFIYIVNTYTESCSENDIGDGKTYLQDREKILKLATGNLMPDLTLPDTTNTQMPLLHVAYQNKLTLVLFWASWCPHCQEEIKDLQKLYFTYNKKGFEIYAISLDEDKNQWLSFLTFNSLPWLNVHDSGGFHSRSADRFYIKKFPSSYLLNQNGIILAKDVSVNYLEEKLKTITE